jgi:hypothetical protein
MPKLIASLAALIANGPFVQIFYAISFTLAIYSSGG